MSQTNQMQMNDYQTIVVGTDGSALAGPTVARAAWLALREDADLIIVCAWSSISRRAEAKNVNSLGNDPSSLGQVHGRQAATKAVQDGVAIARSYGARVKAALLVDGEPGSALLQIAGQHQADLIVVGAIQDVSIADRLLGTVATDVVKRATCEVLIVRPSMPVTELVVPEDNPDAPPVPEEVPVDWGEADTPSGE
ncbi:MULTISPECIES: universal stress protein [unclassified Luteococcus]|uniref:universal stress protein n=1 Tax=unclassified Luteococcus TaxID=2639923 RepID=UPI00313EB8A8